MSSTTPPVGWVHQSPAVFGSLTRHAPRLLGGLLGVTLRQETQVRLWEGYPVVPAACVPWPPDTFAIFPDEVQPGAFVLLGSHSVLVVPGQKINPREVRAACRPDRRGQAGRSEAPR